MRWLWNTLTTVLRGGVIVALVTTAVAQKPSMAPPAKPAPMAQPAPPPAAPAPQHQVVVVEPVRVFDPFFDYPYPYAYSPDYMQANFGYVKLKTDLKDASVYVDGGFADKISKVKKFALRPGNHNIEVRDKEGANIFQQRVAVLVGKTTELRVG